MDNIKVNRLKFFLKFIATDLENLRPYKIHILHNELCLHVHETSLIEVMNIEVKESKYLNDFYNTRRDKLRNKEPLFSREMSDASNTKLKELTSKQQLLREKAEAIFSVIGSLQAEEHDRVDLPERPLLKSKGSYNIDLFIIGDTFQISKDFGYSFNKNMVFHFINSFEGISWSNFARCPECHNWFVNVTRKKKIYCSNRCASRFSMREKRKELKESQSEEYYKGLKNGAKRARKSHVKKHKMKTPTFK